MSLVCFTDGSAINNGKPNAIASYSVVWPDFPDMNVAEVIPPPCTNNRGEFSGAIKAIELAKVMDPSGDKPLVIYTDSMLMINSLTKWIKGWKKNNWVKSDGKDVLNKDLLELIDQGMKDRNIQFIHVKAHTKDDSFEANNNRLADELAKKAIEMKRV